MESMISEYIAQIPPARMIELDIPFERLINYVRHLFCLDALNATAHSETGIQNEITRNHYSSNNYESEFLRVRKLHGEIPRRTMLRYILLMGIPYINRTLIDERLLTLGYLPLTEGHTGLKGALADDLLIGLLQMYETECGGKDPLACRQWMFEKLQILDQYAKDIGKDEYRLIHFRTLSTMVGYGEGI